MSAPPFEGAAVDGRGEGVVHDEGHAVTVCHAGEFLYVEHLQRGVGNGFAEEGFCLGAEGGGYLVLAGIGVYEGDADAEFLHRHGEEVVRAAIDARGAYEVVARLANVEHGVEVGRLPAGGEHPSHAAFECRYLGRHRIAGGVLQPGVEVAFVFQVEEAGHLLAGVVFECGALVYGQYAGFALAGFPTGLHAKGFGRKHIQRLVIND